MTEQTALDRAHAAMEAAPGDDAARLGFYDALAGAELFVLLAREAVGETVEPDIYEVDEARFVLVFDRAERLTGFTGRPSPYAALSGRMLARMLAGQGVGLALNPDVAPSAMLIPAEAVDWLNGTLARGPAEAEARLTEIRAPGGLPEALLTALDRKLASAAGLARFAYLVGAGYEGGGAGHMLAFVDARPGAEPALANAVSEALTFSGIEAGALDVAFFAAADPVAARLARHGLRFDLPEPRRPQVPGAPGMDPDAPPKLR